MQIAVYLGKCDREFGKESVFFVSIEDNYEAVLREIGFGISAVLCVIFIIFHQLFKRNCGEK